MRMLSDLTHSHMIEKQLISETGLSERVKEIPSAAVLSYDDDIIRDIEMSFALTGCKSPPGIKVMPGGK